MHRPVHSSFIHPFISCSTNPPSHTHPPGLTKRSNEPIKKTKNTTWPETRHCSVVPCVAPKARQRRSRMPGRGDDGARTGRVQMSAPIGVRGWRLHLPKQTAQRSRVLHLSLWITPLSHPPVSPCPVLTAHYSKFIHHAEWWGLWNVKLQLQNFGLMMDELTMVVGCWVGKTRELFVNLEE